MKFTITQQLTTFACTFTLLLSYLIYTQTLKTDPTLYTQCINLLSHKIIYIDHPPLVELLFYHLIYIGQYFNSLFLFFNIFSSFLMTINIFLLFKFISKRNSKLESIFFVCIFFIKNIFVINRSIFLLFIFLMYLNFKKPKSIFLGLMMSTNQIGFLVLTKYVYKRKYKIIFQSIIYYLIIFIFFISKLQNTGSNPNYEPKFSNEDKDLSFNEETLNSNDKILFSIEFISKYSAEPCDKYVLDRALITLLNRNIQSYLTYNELIFGNIVKTEECIFEIIKVHVENSPAFDISSSNSMYFKDRDYFKLKHYKSNLLLSSKIKDIKDKFNEVYLTSEDNEECLWQFTFEDTQKNISSIFSKMFSKFNSTDKNIENEFLMSRTTLFRIKHVSTGSELNIKSDGFTAATSSESLIKSRYFYIEDCFNNNYYKYNLKDKKVKEKILSFPKLNIFYKLIEYHNLLINELKITNNGFIQLIVVLLILLIIDLFRIKFNRKYLILYLQVLVGELVNLKSGLGKVVGVVVLSRWIYRLKVYQRWVILGCVAAILWKY